MKKHLSKVYEGLVINLKIDIFGHTRFRLTILYSGMLMLFLLLFISIVYSMFYYIISNEQKQEVIEMATQEWISHQVQYKNLLIGNKKEQSNQKITANKESFFYYLVNSKYHFVAGEENIPSLRPEILKELNGWPAKSDVVRYKTFTFSDGQKIYLQITGKAIYAKGQIIGIFFIGRDLTFYYHMFEWLFFILVGLSFVFILIASVVGYFMARRAMIPIVEAYARQQEFVADASHELRTPLSVVTSSIEVIEMEEKDNMSDFGYKVLLDMKDEVRSMTKLLGDLLTLARSDSGLHQLQYEIFDFSIVVEQIIKSIQTLANTRKVEIFLDAPISLPVNGDKERLRQLVYILLDNAVKFTPNGEVKISLINNAIDQQRNLCIKVQDTGIGILPAQIERMFDRFYQGDKSRSRETGGAGLGLAIAKWIVEAHRGKIEVSSNPEKGTMFIVLIPNEA